MPTTEIDTAPMELAIAASASALEAGNMPFGAVLVDQDGQVLMVAQNNQNTQHDCTGHAELVLVRQASERLGPQSLRGNTVYASGEPCAMCCGALFWAGVGRVVFAATQDDIAQALGGPLLPISSHTVLAQTQPAVQVDGPFMAQAAIAVLKRFPLAME